MSGWTEEREQTLRDMVRDGKPRSAIAAALGVTRNAIIGKVHRLGLSVPKQEMPPSRRMSGAAQRAMMVRVADRKRQKAKRAEAAEAAKVKPDGCDKLLAERDRMLGTVRELESMVDGLNMAIKTLEDDEPAGEPITLLELGHGDCRWPVGEVDGPDTLFCGARSELGTPYCEHHNALARGKQPQGRTTPARRGA